MELFCTTRSECHHAGGKSVHVADACSCNKPRTMPLAAHSCRCRRRPWIAQQCTCSCDSWPWTAEQHVAWLIQWDHCQSVLCSSASNLASDHGSSSSLDAGAATSSSTSCSGTGVGTRGRGHQEAAKMPPSAVPADHMPSAGRLRSARPSSRTRRGRRSQQERIQSRMDKRAANIARRCNSGRPEWMCAACAQSNCMSYPTCRSCSLERPMCLPLHPGVPVPPWPEWSTWEAVQQSLFRGPNAPPPPAPPLRSLANHRLQMRLQRRVLPIHLLIFALANALCLLGIA